MDTAGKTLALAPWKRSRRRFGEPDFGPTSAAPKRLSFPVKTMTACSVFGFSLFFLPLCDNETACPFPHSVVPHPGFFIGGSPNVPDLEHVDAICHTIFALFLLAPSLTPPPHPLTFPTRSTWATHGRSCGQRPSPQ